MYLQLTPFSTLKLIDLTSTSPFGLMIGTLSNTISSDSMTFPRPWSTDTRCQQQIMPTIPVQWFLQPRHALFALSSTLELLTSFFWYLPSLTSSMASSRSDTREV